LLPVSGPIREIVMPKLRWADPLLGQPPREVVHAVWRALTNTDCTWSCRGRFYAGRIDLHPVQGTAIAVLTAAERTKAWKASLARELIQSHAAQLRLEIVDFRAECRL
jgi:hypothetical protein